MKSNEDILNDLFGKTPDHFCRTEVLLAMDIAINHYKVIKTTTGENILFDSFSYETLKKHALFFDKKRHHVMTVWQSPDKKRIVAPVAKLLIGAEGKSIIHYKDRNPFNLKVDNIELVSWQTAHFKQRKASTEKSSIYKGVSWNKFAKKYSAYIKINYENKYLGYFTEEKDAAIAYNTAAVKHFGKEYSKLNVIP